MKDLINTHFDELLLFVVLVLGGVLYFFRPDTKDVILIPAAAALFMALRGKMSNGNGHPPDPTK